MSQKKVTIKKQGDKYEWSQTDESLTIYFPIKNVLLKNIDVLYTDLFIKINASSIKYFSIIDFSMTIDYEDPRNRIQLHDERLEIFLIKSQIGHWDNITVENMNKEDLIKRREESLLRYNQRQEEKYKQAEKKKLEMDKYSIDQQMKVEQFQRKQLKSKKEEEKRTVENELYDELEHIEQQNVQPNKLQDTQQKQEITLTKNQEKINEFNKKEDEKNNFSFNNQQKNIFEDEDYVKPSANEDNIIWNDTQASSQVQEDIQEIEEIPKEIPQPRQKQDVKMQFTEKKFPHLPARESHLKEAPYPKSKTIEKKKDDVYIDIEDRDPLWLKDKGDHFYKRNDFLSAVNAYSKALEFDKEFMMCRLNRASTWLKVRSFENCIADCNDIESQIQTLKEAEREDEFYHKMLARICVKKGAAYAWLSQFDLAIENLEKSITYKMMFTAQEIEEIQKDIERIKNRQKSFDIKQQGDLMFAENDIEGALTKYQEAQLLDEHNEYAWANIGLIHMKRQEYQKCIEYSSRALEIINFFQSDTKSFSKDNRLEVKLLLRRGKSYQMLGDLENAKTDLDQCVMLEPQNGEARTILKQVQEKLDGLLFVQYRGQANEYLQNKKFAEALEYYEKCLKITKKGTSLDNIAVYVNKIACLLSLDKNERVITESNDALRLIKNFRNRFEERQSADEKKKLQQMELRVSVRRGNALAKLNRVNEAIQEYERALKMDPNNETLKKDIEILKRDGLWLGDLVGASNKFLLKKNGITHILTVAAGLMPKFPTLLTYKLINILDSPASNIKQHFPSCIQFIKDAISSGGSVLVHCYAGVSRSATTVIAYLMHENEMTFNSAFQHVKKQRYFINPNDGFRRQLLQFSKELRVRRTINKEEISTVQISGKEEDVKVQTLISSEKPKILQINGKGAQSAFKQQSYQSVQSKVEIISPITKDILTSQNIFTQERISNNMNGRTFTQTTGKRVLYGSPQPKSNKMLLQQLAFQQKNNGITSKFLQSSGKNTSQAGSPLRIQPLIQAYSKTEKAFSGKMISQMNGASYKGLKQNLLVSKF